MRRLSKSNNPDYLCQTCCLSHAPVVFIAILPEWQHRIAQRSLH
ncbi:hypothetical protein [Nostoc sp. PA-18-2419]|nr:hypothetical protein [Nostoc sp. PA-18-2419]